MFLSFIKQQDIQSGNENNGRNISKIPPTSKFARGCHSSQQLTIRLKYCYSETDLKDTMQK